MYTIVGVGTQTYTLNRDRKFMIATNSAMYFNSVSKAKEFWRLNCYRLGDDGLPVATHVWIRGPRGGLHRIMG